MRRWHMGSGMASGMTSGMASALLCLGALAAAGLGGCDDSEDFEGAVIECIGMAYGQPRAGYSRVATRYGARCNWLVSDTIYDDRPAVAGPENFGEPNTVVMTFVTRGTTWVAREGDTRVTLNEGDRMEGTYDVLARDPEGNPLRIRGPFDFCAYGQRADCPHQSAGGLEQHVGFVDPIGITGAFESTYASECRVLIDRGRRAMQVDLQLGVFNGINIAHWIDGCEVPQAPLDRFTFRSGGVDGPGEYGPYTARTLPHPDGSEVVLPALEFDLPLHYLGGPAACLTGIGRLASVRVKPDITACSWRIDADPGRFELRCANASRTFTNQSGLGDIGDFELQAECDVRFAD